MTTREEALEHFGVKGMHWGVRRNPRTGERPIARALNDSKFGQRSHQNVQKHHARKSATADAKERRATLDAFGRSTRKTATVNARIKEKSAANDLYAKEYKKAQQRHANAAVAAKVAKIAAGVIMVNILLGSGSTVSRTSAKAGRTFINGNPTMMTAKISKAGVYKITTLK